MAGIVSLSETGANEGETRLHEAFVVPATTIRAFLVRLQARPVAEKQGIHVADWQPILDRLGAQDVAVSDIPARLLAFVEEAQKQAAKPMPVSNDGADIDAAIVVSRAKLRELDTAGPLKVLQAKLDEEEQERIRRRVPRLKERAAVERLAIDYDAAKQSLAEVTRLGPEDVWAFNRSRRSLCDHGAARRSHEGLSERRSGGAAARKRARSLGELREDRRRARGARRPRGRAEILFRQPRH